MPAAGLHAARTGNRQLELLDLHRSDIDPARAGNLALEGRTGHLVDLDVARAGDGRAMQLRNGDDEMRAAMAEAPLEEAVLLCGWMTSLSPWTSTMVRSSSFSPPRAATDGVDPVRTSTSYGPATSIAEKLPTL